MDEMYEDYMEDTKICNICGVERPVSQFYLSSTGKPQARCKECLKMAENAKWKQKVQERGGGSEKVGVQPNVWFDEIQKKQTHMVLEICGFKQNEENGVWYKLPLKTKDNEWPMVKPYVKEKRRTKVKGAYENTYVKNIIRENLDDIINKRRQGYSYRDIASIYEVSFSSIRKYFTKNKINGTR